MKKLLAAILMCIGLAGCVTADQYGNFTDTASELNQQMVDDVMKIMATFYPPATTRLNLQQPAMDSFGANLVRNLRAKGYAINEVQPNKGWIWSRPADESKPNDAGIAFRYNVAQTGEGETALVLRFGRHAFSRSYTVKGTKLEPTGYWVRKE